MSKETREVEGFVPYVPDRRPEDAPGFYNSNEAGAWSDGYRTARDKGNAAIASLREQVESLQHKLGAAAQEIPEVAGPVDHRIRMIRASLSDAVREERARVAELESDRERLDWLEANGLHMTWGVVHGKGTLREAIDDARRALDTKGGER